MLVALCLLVRLGEAIAHQAPPADASAQTGD